MSTNRTARTPLALGVVAVTAALGLSACVPTSEPQPATQESSAAQPSTTDSSPESSVAAPAVEPTTEPTDDSTGEPAAEPAVEPTGDSTGAVDQPSTDAKGAPAGNTIDAASMEGDPLEVIQGTGGDTVRVPEHDEPIVAVFENTSAEQYSYLYGTSGDGEVLPGADTGQTNVLLVDPYDMSGGLSSETTSWDIEGDAEETFELSFYALDAIPEAGAGDTIGADGFGLVHWSADEDAYLGVDFQGDGNFIVRGETTEDTGQGTQYVFNEIGSGQGGLEIGEGEHLIVVEADGPWSFEPMTEQEYDAIPGERS